MLRNYLKESTEFFKRENNPLFYLFIIPKLVKSDVETTKQDQDLMNLINFVEENSKSLKLAQLEKKYSPITFFNLFSTDTVKKNAIEYIKEYLQNFETDLALDEKDFMESYKVHQTFDIIRNSDQFKVFTKNL